MSFIMLSRCEVSKHNSRASCWVIISDQVYDLTDFLEEHPGGASVILRYAGKDATAEYDPVHPEGTIQKSLSADKALGPVEPATTQESQHLDRGHSSPGDATGPLPISFCQNLDQLEVEARKILSRKAWIYYSSAADSLSSLSANAIDWKKITFRPRILRNVTKVSMRQRIMGQDSALPVFIAPAALAKLGHEDGEMCLARGAGRADIPYCTSTYSSIKHETLAACLREENSGGSLIFQLYVPVIKERAKDLIAEARRLGFKALVLTVDCAVIGKREEEDRYKAELDFEAGVDTQRTMNTSPDVDAPVLRGGHSSALDWNDLPWIRQAWGNSGPIILKGIQTAEDALLATQAGVDGIYLSNHGGRQLDFAPSSIKTLLEIRRFCPEIIGRVEIYLDGGVRKGTDVLKALCLGATAVAIGRPFMYALSAYGTDGVSKAIDILSDEIQTSMRLLGVTDLSQLNEYYVNTSTLELELPKKFTFEDLRQSSKL